MFYKKAILENFAMPTELVIKLQAFKSFLRHFKENYSEELMQTAASVIFCEICEILRTPSGNCYISNIFKNFANISNKLETESFIVKIRGCCKLQSVIL